MKKFLIALVLFFALSGTSFAAFSPGFGAQSLLNDGTQVIINTPSPTSGARNLPISPDLIVSGDAYRLHPRDVISNDARDNVDVPLQRFGMDFFAKKRSSTARATISDSYVIAPGDEMRLSLWSIEEVHQNLRVAADGTVALPLAGPVTIGGMTFSEARAIVKAAYSRVLSDFQMNLTMGSLGSITVYVTGRAQNPGSYSVPSTATMLDVLAEASGPSLSGSMRKIELRRHNRTIAKLDAYDLLLRGKLDSDLRLIDGDVIFIDTVGALIGIAGNVKHPAVYELMNKEAKLSDALGLAGGISSGAFKGRVQISRVQSNEYRTLLETDLAAAHVGNHRVSDGDLIKIFAVPSDVEMVQVVGAVASPGEFAITPGVTTLSDVLMRAGGLLYNASGEGELSRTDITPSGQVTTRTPLDLKSILNGKGNITLQRSDYVFVRTIPDWQTAGSAEVSGKVMHPGAYSVQRGERLSAFIARVGGYAANAFPRGAIFSRESVRIEQQRSIEEMVARFEREVASSVNESVSTAVNDRDINFARESAIQKMNLVERMKRLQATGRIVVVIPDDYKLLKGSPYDIEMMSGDKLHIPERPGTVQVLGSVLAPMAFVFRAGQPFTEYVKVAGGYTQFADVRGSYIVGADGTTKKAYSGKTPHKLVEGDFVIVPEKVVFKPGFRNTADVVDVLYKMVLGVASINYIFK